LKPSFSILELVIVIIIIGILASTFMIPSSVNKLQLATDTIEKYINFTHSLALKEDMYQPFPKENNVTENNRSKYWFKQWWQIRFTRDKNDPKYFWCEVFSDQPYDKDAQNFDRKGATPTNTWDKSFAKNPLDGKYLIGKCGSGFPPCDKITKELALSEKYGIKQILFDGKNVNWNTPKRIIFDNFGNVFLSEGEIGDKGDINPLDSSERILLTHNLIIKLCTDNNCNKNFCKEIIVTPTGNIYQSSCN